MHASSPLLGLKVPIGFGFMNASWGNSPILDAGAERDNFVAALHYAMDAGVRLFDTSDIYAPSWQRFGHNEVLLREAVESWTGSAAAKSELVLATKGGITRGPADGGEDTKGIGEAWGKNGSFEYLLKASEASAERLGVDTIPLWQHHRLATNLTLGEQLVNLRKLREQGPIRHIGVSNYSKVQLLRALDVVGGPSDGGIISVQNQLNPVYRQQLDVLEVCEEYGLAYLPWSPTKGVRGTDLGTEVHSRFRAVAEAQGVSTYAVAQAWIRSLSPNIVPLPGVTKLASIEDSISTVDLRLTAAESESLGDLPESWPLDAELVRDQPLAD